jgi:hypothetical protein
MGVCASKNMPPAAYDDWAPAARVLARPELWGIIAEHSGVVGAWGLTGGVGADWGVQGFSRGGEGVAATPAGAGGVRRVMRWGTRDEGDEGVRRVMRGLLHERGF